MAIFMRVDAALYQEILTVLDPDSNLFHALESDSQPILGSAVWVQEDVNRIISERYSDRHPGMQAMASDDITENFESDYGMEMMNEAISEFVHDWFESIDLTQKKMEQIKG